MKLSVVMSFLLAMLTSTFPTTICDFIGLPTARKDITQAAGLSSARHSDFRRMFC